MSNSSAPLLQLYSDIWTHITDLLDIEDLRKLLCTGNPTLQSLLKRSTRSLNCLWKSTRSVDLDRLLTLSNQLECLESVSFDCIYQTIWMKKSSQELILPRTLTSLSLKLSHTADRLLCCDLASQVPNLKKLSLTGAVSRSLRVGSFELPSTLEELCLHVHNGAISIMEGDLERLPRALVDLRLAPVYEMVVRKSTEWPPHLTFLQINASSCKIDIDTLPRTLTSLQVDDSRGLKTKFASEDVEFPWRLYFPRLVRLVVSPSEPMSSNFFASLLLDDVVPHENFVETWHTDPSLPDLALAPSSKAAYPLLQLFSGPTPFDHPSFTLESVKRLAPLLTSLNMWVTDEMPLTFLEFFPSLKTLTRDEDLPKGIKLPPSIVDLDCKKVYIQDLPPHLHTLRCTSLIGIEQEDGSTTLDGCHLPQSLEYLFYLKNVLPLAIARMLPPKILTCCVDLGTVEGVQRPGEVWHELATRLPSLTNLVLDIRDWDFEPLTPLSSTNCDTLSLQFADGFGFEATRPRLNEFFNAFPAGQLKSLDLHSGTTKWPLAMIPELPQSLTELRIWSASWISTTKEEFPLGHSMSPEELIAALPPTLGLLFLMGENGDAKETPKDAEVLTHLPHNLGFILSSDLFKAPELNDDDAKVSWARGLAKRLPPNLSSIFVSEVHKLVEIYFTEVRTDIYNDYTHTR